MAVMQDQGGSEAHLGSGHLAVLCWGGIRCAAGLGKQSWGLGVLLGEGLGG